MNRTLVILNPAARGERARAMRKKIESLSSKADIRMTSTPGHAREMAESGVIEGYHSIVAAGGDGTVNEVVNGIAGSTTAFGILPVGTMNVFAAELGIPGGNIERAWQIIEEGHVRSLDLPCANEAHFVQLAGVGLDAEVVRRTTPDSKKALGPMSYLISLAQVAADRPPQIHVEPEDAPAHTGSFVLVGNGRFYGGPFTLFPKARPDDGLLDVLVFKNQSHWDVVRYFQAIAFRTHADLPDVEYFQTSSMMLSAAGDVPVELDGELTGTLPCRFGISSHKLNVLAPARS